jgi:hypothetical protein
MPAIAARLALLVMYIVCAILIVHFGRWRAAVPVDLLLAYQAFWVVMRDAAQTSQPGSTSDEIVGDTADLRESGNRT